MSITRGFRGERVEEDGDIDNGAGVALTCYYLVMSIECDHCHVQWEADTDDFDEFVADTRDLGWRHRKEGAVWRNYCAGCPAAMSATAEADLREMERTRALDALMAARRELDQRIEDVERRVAQQRRAGDLKCAGMEDEMCELVLQIENLGRIETLARKGAFAGLAARIEAERKEASLSWRQLRRTPS